MAFEDSATAGMTGNGNAPTTAPAPQPEPTSTVSAPTNLQPPPAPAPTAPSRPPMQPSVPPVQTEENKTPGQFFKHLSHSFAGAILGSLAGPAPVDYTVDASGKTVATPRPDSTASRLRRLAESALIGLAAGSRVPPERNRAAAWGAGLGAGAEAGIGRAQQQDLLKRQQAQQDYEAQEKAKMDNAVRAMHLASTYSLWQKAMLEEQDHDPERQKNMDIVTAARDYIGRNPATEMSVDIVSPEQAKAIHDQEIAALKNDPAHGTKLSVMLPLGMTQAKDADGKPLFEQDGATPKQVGQVAVIKGGDKIPIPQSFVDDAMEYGSLAGIAGADRLTTGQEIPIASFLTMDAKLNAAKRQEIDGWKNAKVLKRPDGTEVLVNSVTGKVREAPSTSGAQPALNLQKIQDELNKGVTGERAAEIAAGLQTQIDDAANAAIKPTLQKLQKQANTQAQASTKYATGKAGAVAGAEAKAKQQYDTKPVYAITTDAQGNQHTVMTTTAEAQQRNMTGIRPVKQPDIRNDQHDIKVLNDIQVKSSNVRAAASVMDNTSWTDSAAIAKYLADNPNTTMNQLMKSSIFGHASPHAVAYAIAINSLRESAMGLQKVLTGTARTNETQLQALQNTLPGVEPTAAIVGQKLDAFDQNLVMLVQGLPENTGVQIRVGRGQAQQAPQSAPATHPTSHVFDPVAWQKTHPGQDVNAAIAYAKSQGYEVKQ